MPFSLFFLLLGSQVLLAFFILSLLALEVVILFSELEVLMIFVLGFFNHEILVLLILIKYE